MKINNKTILGAIAYILFFIPLLLKETDPSVKYHTKQGTGLFIFAAAMRGILDALYGPPFTSLGSSLSSLLLHPVHIVLLILIVIGIMNALNQRQKPLPVIGVYSEKL